MKNGLIAVLAFFVVSSAFGQAQQQTKIRITTWNLEWFPNGSPREAPPEKQAQRIQAAADVLRKLDPDILLLQEVRDYDACANDLTNDKSLSAVWRAAICSPANYHEGNAMADLDESNNDIKNVLYLMIGRPNIVLVHSEAPIG